MNANKYGMGTLWMTLALALPFSAQAVQGLDSSGQTKVNKAMAQRWMQKGGTENTPTQDKRVVNVGNKRSGTCNVNVGTAPADSRTGRAPKDIVVTTKEVINVCK